VLPTILTLLGMESPPGPGAPLLDAAGHPTPPPADEDIVAETRLSGAATAALIAGPWKAILNEGSGRMELYDWRRDPGEQHDQAGIHPQRVGYARQRLLELNARVAESAETAQAPPLDDATRDRLEALGYLH
jgi:arylsulfatase A-like enzyme